MKKLLVILMLLVLSIPSIAWSASYYVEIGGNDSAAGSQVAPWAHCPGMQDWSGSATLSGGDSVYFNNADTWTLPGHILVCQGGVTYDGTTWGDGISGTDKAKLDYDGGSCNYSISGASPGYALVMIQASDVTFKGFEIDGNSPSGTSNYGISVGDYQSSDYSNFSNVLIDDCEVHHVAQRGIYIGSQGGAATRTISYVTVQNTDVHHVALGTQTYSGTGFVIYPQWSTYSRDRLENITITNCKSYSNNLTGFEIKDEIDALVIEGCDVYDNGIGLYAGNGLGLLCESGEDHPLEAITIRSCSIHGNSGSGINVANSDGLTIGPISIYNNLVYDNALDNDGGQNYGSEIRAGSSMSSSVVNIYNNTIYGPDTDGGYQSPYAACYIGSGNGSATYVVRNNIIYTIDDYCFYDDGGIATHSNNLFYRTSADTDAHVYYGGSTYDRDGTASDVTNWEATAQKTDPLFVTLGSDFSLQVGSPAIDNGTDLSGVFTTDYNGNTRSGTWDIGAYEYGAGAVTRPCSISPGTSSSISPGTSHEWAGSN